MRCELSFTCTGPRAPQHALTCPRKCMRRRFSFSPPAPSLANTRIRRDLGSSPVARASACAHARMCCTLSFTCTGPRAPQHARTRSRKCIRRRLSSSPPVPARTSPFARAQAPAHASQVEHLGTHSRALALACRAEPLATRTRRIRTSFLAHPRANARSCSPASHFGSIERRSLGLSIAAAARLQAQLPAARHG